MTDSANKGKATSKKEIKVGDLVDAKSFLSPEEVVRGKALAVEEIDGKICVTVPFLAGTLRTRHWKKVENHS